MATADYTGFIRKWLKLAYGEFPLNYTKERIVTMEHLIIRNYMRTSNDKLPYPVLKALSDQLYEIEKTFYEENFSAFYFLQPNKEWIGIGISGHDAYDYSGKLVPFSDVNQLLQSPISDVYTGNWKASHVSGMGRFYESIEDCLRETAEETIRENNPYPYFLDEDCTQEYEVAYDWELEMEVLAEAIYDHLTFSQVVRQSPHSRREKTQ